MAKARILLGLRVKFWFAKEQLGMDIPALWFGLQDFPELANQPLRLLSNGNFSIAGCNRMCSMAIIFVTASMQISDSHRKIVLKIFVERQKWPSSLRAPVLLSLLPSSHLTK